MQLPKRVKLKTTLVMAKGTTPDGNLERGAFPKGTIINLEEASELTRRDVIAELEANTGHIEILPDPPKPSAPPVSEEKKKASPAKPLKKLGKTKKGGETKEE